jgi:non-ribosomal peptide synthetase component F
MKAMIETNTKSRFAPATRTKVEPRLRAKTSPREKTVARLFEEQVERAPNAVAVEFQQERASYRELNERANQLAHRLQALDVGPDARDLEGRRRLRRH